MNLRSLARTLGGVVAGRDTVTCPGPGHSKGDRSLSVTFNDADDNFVVYSHAGDDPLLCRDHVRRRLGLPEWQPGDGQNPTVARERNGLDREAAEPGPDDSARIERALAMWDNAKDPRRTAAEVYLKARALELPGDLAGTVLRFNPRTPWRNEDTGRTGLVPALIVAFRRIDDDTITAVHRIRLDQPEHWPKADRKMRGITGTSAVKLDPISGERLVIAEGIETAMAGRMLGLKPAWALGSAGAIRSFPVVDLIDELVLLAEPDKTNAKAINECGLRYRAAGIRVRVAQARTGDMNDVLMERPTRSDEPPFRILDFDEWLVEATKEFGLEDEADADANVEAKADADNAGANGQQSAPASRDDNNGTAAPEPPITAKPYGWPDPATIPRREALFDGHYVRKTVGATIAAGGRAKTTLATLEAVSMAAGRNLLTGETLEKPLRVWLLNGEEDQDELDRRVAAVCQHHNISKADCGDRLFIESVLEKRLKLATLVRNVPALNTAALNCIEAEISAKQIDVLMLDPLVSLHSVAENNSTDMDLLLKDGLGGIAHRTGSHCEVFHHPGKARPGQETLVEDARGSSAIIWAVRHARVLNFMTTDEAERLGIAEDVRRLHVRQTNGKFNVGPIGKANWFKLFIENLPNGDAVACASSFKPENPFKNVTAADMHKCRTLARTGAYRVDSRAKEWIGFAVAEVLKINVTYQGDNDRKDLAKIKQILSVWYKTKVLIEVDREDENRKKRKYVAPGPWKEDAAEPGSIEPETDENSPL
jgi:hypothetical protein